MAEPTADYDSPWKELLERYFQPFMALLYPDIHDDVDCSAGYEFLDKELQEVVRDSESGRRYVDKLVGVTRRSGEGARVFVHLEVQGQREAEFEERVYRYNYRLFDRYESDVVSLVVLADDDPRWRPTAYRRELWGCEAILRFRPAKLLDWRERWDELEASDNPVATVIMAHLESLATQGDPEARYRSKWRLMRRLLERGFSRQDVLELLRLIDWLMALPPVLEERLRTDLWQMQEEKKVPYITSFERLGRRDGLKEGMQQGVQQGIPQGMRRQLLRVLRERFGQVPEEVDARLVGLGADALEDLVGEALRADSLDAFSQRIPAPAG